MAPHAEFLRRRRWWTIGRVAIGGYLLLVVLGKLSGRLDLTFPGMLISVVLLIVWSTAGAKWVLRPMPGNSTASLDVDDQRQWRRTKLAAAVIPGWVLLRQLLQIFESRNTVAEMIVLPLIAVALSVAIWWVLATALWHYNRIRRASQNRAH